MEDSHRDWCQAGVVKRRAEGNCERCGGALAPGARFCATCGAPNEGSARIWMDVVVAAAVAVVIAAVLLVFVVVDDSSVPAEAGDGLSTTSVIDVPAPIPPTTSAGTSGATSTAVAAAPTSSTIDSVETTTAAALVRLEASLVVASSTAPAGVDLAGNQVSYRAENVREGIEGTAWRTAGDGLGERLVLEFGRLVRVTEIGLIPGYAKIDPVDGTDRFAQNRRVRTISYTFSDGTSVVHDLLDEPRPQLIDTAVSTRSVSVEVLATTEHGGRDFTAISELYVYGYELDTPETTTIQNEAEAITFVFPIDPIEAAAYSPGGHTYPATDVFAPIGTRFVAVTSGVVDEVSRSDRWDAVTNAPALRGGLFVSIIGDDGVRYYGSHLSTGADGIEPGTRVAAGQLLGAVGVSGSAAGTTPHVHFGISAPTFSGDWETRRGTVDPIPFLDEWRNG